MKYPHYHVFLTLQEVRRRTGLSRSTIYNKINEGTFPRQVNVGPRGVRWLEREITDWIQLCLDERDGTATKPKQRKTRRAR